MNVVSAILMVISLLVMVAWAVYAGVSYYRHRLPSFYPGAASGALLGLAYATGGKWDTAMISFAWVIALIGWQQTLTWLDEERSLNRQVRDMSC